MNWMQRFAKSDIERIKSNIERLESLKQKVHDLGYFAVASNSGGYHALKSLLDERIVAGRPKVKTKLEDALVGENNQKIALDSPTRFQGMMFEAEALIDREIGLERRALRELQDE